MLPLLLLPLLLLPLLVLPLLEVQVQALLALPVLVLPLLVLVLIHPGLPNITLPLFVLPQLIAQLGEMIAEDKGEVKAEVTSAKALSKAQSDNLAKTLKARIGRDVKLKTTVDESLIGGLVVKVGSKLIDTSIRSKLAALQNAMREVG